VDLDSELGIWGEGVAARYLDRKGYAILEEDGTLNEQPSFVIRPH